MFKRNSKTDLAYKTEDGQINVRVSSLNYDVEDDGEAYGPDEKPERKFSKGDQSMRNTQPQSILPELISTSLPSVTNFATRPMENQFRSQNETS